MFGLVFFPVFESGSPVLTTPIRKRGTAMRSLAMLLVLVSLGMFAVGCGGPADPPEGDTGPVDIEEPTDMADDPGDETVVDETEVEETDVIEEPVVEETEVDETVVEEEVVDETPAP